ncbi:MAG: TonB-dependent receptor domain-containing protein, partial [Blastocatellia bacterium]
MGEFQNNSSRQDGLGIGGFDLPDRAYSQQQSETLIRFRDTGLLTKRLVNEVLFQYRGADVRQSPVTNGPAVIVLDSFNDAGAQLVSDRKSSEVMFADNIDFASSNHSMRVGVLTEVDRYHTRDLQNAGGTFIFSSLQDFRAGRPATFTQRAGDPNISFGQDQVGLYFEDDVRLRKNLTLSWGLRYELQTHVPDHHSVSPRFGLAWAPTADGKLVIRAGAGIFYAWVPSQVYEQTLLVNGIRQHDIVVTNPGFPNPMASGILVSLPPSVIEQSPDLTLPYVEECSISAQRELPKGFSLSA